MGGSWVVVACCCGKGIPEVGGRLCHPAPGCPLADQAETCNSESWKYFKLDQRHILLLTPAPVIQPL